MSELEVAYRLFEPIRLYCIYGFVWLLTIFLFTVALFGRFWRS